MTYIGLADWQFFCMVFAAGLWVARQEFQHKTFCKELKAIKDRIANK